MFDHKATRQEALQGGHNSTYCTGTCGPQLVDVTVMVRCTAQNLLLISRL